MIESGAVPVLKMPSKVERFLVVDRTVNQIFHSQVINVNACPSRVSKAIFVTSRICLTSCTRRGKQAKVMHEA